MNLKNLLNQAQNESSNSNITSQGGSLRDQLSQAQNLSNTEGSINLGATLKDQLNNTLKKIGVN